MSKNQWLVVLVVVVVLVAAVVDGRASEKGATHRSVIYQGVPIPVELPLNVESRVHFEESVEIGLPSALTLKLDVSSVHGVVYLTATQPFMRQRVALKGVQSGRFVLLDVSSTQAPGSVKDLFIRADESSAPQIDSQPLTAAQVMRYVTRLTLAPRRPKSEGSTINRVAIAVAPNTIYRNVAVASTLLAAWRSNKWLAIAIELRNESDDSVRLSPHDVNGFWRSAGFLHTRLLPRGKRGSQTVMFLVGSHDALAEKLH